MSNILTSKHALKYWNLKTPPLLTVNSSMLWAYSSDSTLLTRTFGEKILPTNKISVKMTPNVSIFEALLTFRKVCTQF